MKKKNCIVNIFDFILYLYSHILPEGGLMDPVVLGALVLNFQIFVAFGIYGNPFRDSLREKVFIMYWGLCAIIYFLMLWRNKKNRHLYGRCSIFHLPMWIRILIFLS